MSDREKCLEELHLTQLQILKELDRVCRKYNIRYFLAFGTLLGSVRHHGFIPWDDDIDTVMPYSDYRKLQRIPSEEWGNQFFLQTSETDPYYNKCYMKLRDEQTTLIVRDVAHLDIHHGVAVDIYPMFRLTDRKFRRIFQLSQGALYSLFQENHIPRNHGRILAALSGLFLSIIPERQKRTWKQRLLRELARYEKEETEECFILIGNTGCLRKHFLCSDFRKPIFMPFESIKFPIPVGYDHYLTTWYGNYMELPPENLREIKLSNFIKIDLHHSYKEYRGINYAVE